MTGRIFLVAPLRWIEAVRPWVLHLLFVLLFLFLIEEEAVEPNLELTLGIPGEDDLENRIRRRIFIFAPTRDVPIEDIRTLIDLKSRVIHRMAELDPHGFWADQRNRIIGESILTPQGREYPMTTLAEKLEELNGANAQSSSFFKRLRKMRQDFLLFGRFD